MVDWKDATIHVASHVIHYGTGAFEGLRAYDSKIGTSVFRLEPHMRRMIDSCRVYRMEPKWSQDAAVTGRGPRHRARQRLQELLHPPGDFPRLRLADARPASVPGRGGGDRLGMEPDDGRRGARKRHRRRRQLVDAPGAEHAAGAGEGLGQLCQLRADQDAGNARRLRRRGGAR